MRKTRVLGLVTVVVLVTGCAAFRAMGGNTNVSRNVDVTASGSTCTIANNIAQIDVSNGNSGTLVFHVKPASDFKFVSGSGIDFSKSGAPANEFSTVSSSDTTITIHDRNQTRGTFKYEVNVVPKAPGGTACNLDPTVNNDGTCVEGC